MSILGKLLMLFLLFILVVSCQELNNNKEDGFDSVEIKFDEGTNMAAAVSPDQSSLVFDLLGRLWILSVEGGTPEPITDPYGNARLPQWSPDGHQLLFQAYWTGTWQIYTINKDGTNLKQLTQGPFDHREPSWGANAASIYYAADQTGNYDIYELDLNSGEISNITEQPFNQFAPFWHPEQGLTYINDHPEASGITNNRSGETQLLYQSENELSAASWNTTGRILSFQEAGTLRFLSFSSQEEKETFSWGEKEEDLFPFALSWLDDQQFIYTADGHLKRGNIDGTSNTIPFEVNLSLQRPVYTAKEHSFDQAEHLPVKGIFMPRLSPEGDRAAMILLQDLWLRKANGQMVQLTNDPYVEMAPVWSPDGNQIAFLSDRRGSFGVYIRDLQSNKDRFLTEVGGSVAGLAWSPDGRQLAYAASYGPRQGRLFTYNLVEGKLKQVTGLINSSVGAPSWSPDGQWVALSTLQPYSTRFREGINSVLYIHIETGKKQILAGLPHFSVGTRSYNGPEWSPDGKYLATISSSRLWLLPIDGQRQLEGTPIELTDKLADAPSWSADGKELLYIATDHLEKINVETGQVEKWPLELERQRIVPKERKLIRAGHLFNGIDQTWFSNQDIIIEENRIVDILPASANNELNVDTVIDASGQFVMPGLIDGHNHQGSWEGELLGRTWLAWGVTATRDPASDPYDALNRREAWEAGHTWGARIFFTGSPFDGSRIYYGGANALQDSTQIELELARAKALDYDLIKTYVRLSDPLQQKIIQAAHDMGVPVASHELYPAVSYGMDGLEHILGTSRRGYSPKMSAQNIAYNDVINLIAESGMSFCPTTGIYVSYNYLLAQDTTLLDDPKVKNLMPEFSQFSARQGIAQVQANPIAWQQDFENAMQMVKGVYEKGGLIVAGTDSPIIPYGFAFHLELQAYAAAGIPAFDVLQTATINAAKVLRVENELGSIEQGKLADLIILDANPADDLKNLMQVNQVMINGELIATDKLIKGYK